MPTVGGTRDAPAGVVIDRPDGRQWVYGLSGCVPQSTVISRDDHAVEYDRPRSGHGRSIGAERDNQGLRRGVDDDRGAVVLEVEGIAMLIGSEAGTVHQGSAVNEVEAPATGAHERSGDFRTVSGFFR